MKRRADAPTVQIWLATTAILMIGASGAVFVSKVGASKTLEALALTDCAALDRAARARVAALIDDNSGAGELRLDEALLQLRRARRLCRAGDRITARHDYEVLGGMQPDISKLLLHRD